MKFFHTHDSDQWVRHSLDIGNGHQRVILVTGQGDPPSTVAVCPLDLNAEVGAAPLPPRQYPVDLVCSTLQEAADASRGGDLIAVAPGQYAGFVIHGPRPGAGDGRYIHFKALGSPGDVVINRPQEQANPKWVIHLMATSHIIIEGFNIDGSDFAAATANDPKNPLDLAGILLGGGFATHGQLTHHIVFINNFSHHHTRWGMLTGGVHTALIQGNLFAGSRYEHGCYVSDGSDNFVLRRNVFFANAGCGLQCNLDPNVSLRDTARHPSMSDLRPYGPPFRQWAQELLRLATERFGDNGFPDGRGVNFIIEANVANQNNRHGGAGINLSGLLDSLVQNNLLYDNFSHGIALYAHYHPWDTDLVLGGYAAPEQITGPESLPLFGSHDNLVRNNTVLMSNQGRAAVILVNGSYACTLRNNIFINDGDDAFHIDSYSLWRCDSDCNVMGRVGFSSINPEGYWTAAVKHLPLPMPPTFKSLALCLDEAGRSTVNLSRSDLARHFLADGRESWVVLEGGWWRLNPHRPDFRPRRDSALLGGKADAANLPPLDAAGHPRLAPDIGAFATP